MAFLLPLADFIKTRQETSAVLVTQAASLSKGIQVLGRSPGQRRTQEVGSSIASLITQDIPLRMLTRAGGTDDSNSRTDELLERPQKAT